MKLEDKHSALQPDTKFSTESMPPRKPASFFDEPPPQAIEVAPQVLHRWTRRDLLLFGMGAIAAAAGGGDGFATSVATATGRAAAAVAAAR